MLPPVRVSNTGWLIFLSKDHIKHLRNKWWNKSRSCDVNKEKKVFIFNQFYQC